MQKIIPHLWFDTQAREAAEFYSGIFPESRVLHTTVMHDTPSGDCETVSFQLWGHRFLAISAGPEFSFNPSISFLVNFDPLLFGKSADAKKQATAKLEEIWNKLSEGGKALMPIDKYPFSEKYGWIQDKYGLTWQLMLTNPEGEPRPSIIPSIMFIGENDGKAEEAIKYYTSVFNNSRIGHINRYGKGQSHDKEEHVMFADFMLENYWLAAMDSGMDHKFQFNEAVSLMVNCEDQREIDYYFSELSAVKEAEQCGWLKDKYGLSWQISPTILDTIMTTGTQEQIDKATKAFLKMKKLDISEIERATK